MPVAIKCTAAELKVAHRRHSMSDDLYCEGHGTVESGWAKCAHSEEDVKKLKEEGYLRENYTLERYVYEIMLMGGFPFEVDVDQWFRVSVTGTIEDTAVLTSIQADSIMLGAAETWLRWKKRWEELKGREWTGDDDN